MPRKSQCCGLRKIIPLQVTVLEASDRIGGRVHDDHSMGSCCSRGAMFITGLANNPFTLLSKQAGEKVWEVNEDRCELLTECGGIADKDIDTRVEQQFNNALDRLADWRINKPPDCSLGGRRCTQLENFVCIFSVNHE